MDLEQELLRLGNRIYSKTHNLYLERIHFLNEPDVYRMDDGRKLRFYNLKYHYRQWVIMENETYNDTKDDTIWKVSLHINKNYAPGSLNVLLCFESANEGKKIIISVPNNEKMNNNELSENEKKMVEEYILAMNNQVSSIKYDVDSKEEDRSVKEDDYDSYYPTEEVESFYHDLLQLKRTPTTKNSNSLK